MFPAVAARWLDRVDPGVHRRIKGLRLVTAYGIAALLGALHDLSRGVPDGASLSSLAGGFALWASVSEARGTRAESSRDLAILVASAAAGAAFTACLAGPLAAGRFPGSEATLVAGAFLAGFLKRFGILGAGIGSQFYIGQLLAYGATLGAADLRTVVAAALAAVPAAIIPRVLSGPAEQPPRPLPSPPVVGGPRLVPPELAMGLQAALAAALIVGLNAAIGLEQSAWAITACTYVVANTASGTLDRVRRRILGTIVGVPLGLACLPLVLHAPVLAWMAAALAMVIYAMALPERYDIASGAFAFTLVVTLAAGGEHSVPLLAARLWETILGGVLGLVAAMTIFPIRVSRATRTT